MAKEKTKTEAVTSPDALIGAGKKGKAGKPPKPPKRSKRGGKGSANAAALMDEGGKKKSRDAGKKRKRKGGKLIVLLIILFAVLIIIVGAAFVLIYNEFGIRDKAFDFVYSLDPRERTRDKTLSERSDALDVREADLALRESELDERERGLENESDRLERLREQLAEQSTLLDQRELENTPRYLQPMTEEELADLQRLAKIYSRMTPEEAVEIMSSLYDIQDMVAILYQMNDKNISAILSVMEVSLAVEITEILLHE